jgi:hypothetical protein
MSNSGPGAACDTSPPRSNSFNLTRLVVFSLIAAVAFIILGAGLPWLRTITPRWLVLGTAIWFLWTLLGFYSVAAPIILVVGCWSSLAAVRARRQRDQTALVRSLRWLLLVATCLITLIISELISAIAVQWSYNIPSLPTRFPTAARRHLARSGPDGSSAIEVEESGGTHSNRSADRGLSLVVVGESSARGEPYQPWLSVGQIVGWQLERVFPGRTITVDVRAKGGATLEHALPLLADLKRRPDAIIVFSGHNEFQTRFGWSRTVRHYIEEGPTSPLALLELARSISWTATLILKTLDNYYGEAPPPPGVARELIDHPICTSKEYAATRQDFERRLDALVAYCRAIKARAILIVPGSNDGSFEPNRSVLAGPTPAADRAAFAHAFFTARAAEADPDPTRAVAAYRRLIAHHPEFAESHFRLARLLVRKGEWEEAEEHFVHARDLDGSPIRCPTDFRRVFRSVARRRGALLVDGPALLAGLSPHGILDDHLFHDAHHLSLIGIIALAQDILDQLRARRAFGWPESTTVPRIELADCMRHFELDAEKWTKVCERSAEWFTNTAHFRYDPCERLESSAWYRLAAREIAAGHPLPRTIPRSLAPLAPILETIRAGRGH